MHREPSPSPSRSACLSAVCLLALAGSPAGGTPRFTDVTASTGVTCQHTDGATGRYLIHEAMSAGLALFDYDTDGDIDLYFLNGAAATGPAARNALYRNDGAWHFTDVTETAGVGDTGFGLGVTVGDYDNDGDPDLYLNNFGPNVLYRNDGDGRFTDVTATAGLADGKRMGAGTNFLDADGDGDLDLFVAHYVRTVRELAEPATRGGQPAYLGPAVSLYAPTQDRLYRNNGDGTFTDVTDTAGLVGIRGAAMGTIAGDVDGDGDTDILVANDMSGNHLWLNDGGGHFTEDGLLAGIAFDQHGEAQGSMAPALGDVDNDGRLDLHLTSYQGQSALLLRNLGDGSFRDVTDRSGAGLGTVIKTTWASALVDVDRDGDRDLFIACGHIQPNVEAYDPRARYHQTNLLFANLGGGRFRDISREAGDGLAVRAASRGAGCDDLDNDGDVDIVILNSRQGPTLLRNDTPDPGHWLQIRLRGTRGNRDGVGAGVRVVAGDLIQVDEVHSGRSYQSHYGTRLTFGLGPRTTVDRIEVRWCGGRVEHFRVDSIDRLITLVEGTGLGGP